MNYDYHGGFDTGSPAYFMAAVDFSNADKYDVGQKAGWSVKDSVEDYIKSGYPR